LTNSGASLVPLSGWPAAFAPLVRRRSPKIRWLLAAGILAGSVAVRFALLPWLGAGFPFMVFIPAVMLAAVFSGWLPTIGVLLGTAIAAGAWFLPPLTPFGPAAIGTIIHLAGYLLIGFGELAVFGALADLVRRLEDATGLQHTLSEELRHRVANNMQVVASVLHDGARRVVDPQARDVIERASRRVKSMAYLHRRLCDPAAYDEGLAPVLREVLTAAFTDLPVEAHLRIDCAGLARAQMVALSLLVNEAALNAAKHVFARGRGRRFEVTLAAESPGRHLLLIRDDGPGISQARDETTEPGMGLDILHALAAQLGGTLAISGGPGGRLEVAFADG
jgi:two-component sensor histidine kinase